MTIKITIDRTEWLFITDPSSLDRFIRNNADGFREKAIITPQLAKSFDPFRYIDTFRVKEEVIDGGQGGISTFIPYIVAPYVREMKIGNSMVSVLTVGECIPKAEVEMLIEKTKQLIDEY